MSVGRLALRGGALSYGSFLLSKLMLYLSTIVLARVLLPRDFGLVGYALLAISYLDVVKDLGVTSALIYRQDIEDKDAGEAFLLNLTGGALCCLACWLLAPPIATFFHDPRVVPLLRALSLSFVLSALGGVHIALLQKRMRFGRRFVPDLVQSLIKGGVSVALALQGTGYWSLVWGQLAGIAAATLMGWALLPWLPRLRLHHASSRALLGYGMHITLVNLLGIVINNGDYVIVGRSLGSTSLGLYTLAYTIPQMLTISLSVAVSRVIFPAYAALQHDREALRQGYLSVLRYSALILVPVGVGLYAATPAIVHLLYKPAWWPAAAPMQALSLYAMIYAIGWHAGDMYKATGRPDIQWKLGIAHALVVIPALLLGAHLGGIEGVATAQLLVALPYSLARFWLIRRVLALGVGALVRALLVPAAGGVVLLDVCLALGHLVSEPPGTWYPAGVVLLGLQVLLGGTAYAAVLLLGSGTTAGVVSPRRLPPAHTPAEPTDSGKAWHLSP